MADTPMNEPSLISARDALSMAEIRVLSASFTVRFWPSRAFIDSVLPSTLVISPRTRTGCASCAYTADGVTLNAGPAGPCARRVIFCLVCASLNRRAASSRPYVQSLGPAIEPPEQGHYSPVWIPRWLRNSHVNTGAFSTVLQDGRKVRRASPGGA